MANDTDVIKEFLVSLGFKIDQSGLKKFTGGLDQATKTSITAGKAVLGVAAAAEIAVYAFSASMEKLYFASQRTGASVGNIQALEQGFKQVGLAGGVATESLERMASLIRMNPALKSVADSFLGKDSGKLDQTEAMLQLVEKLSAMPHYVGAQWAQQFGLDEKSFLQVKQHLPELREAQSKLLEMQKNMGLDPDQAARDAHEYQTVWRDITAKMNAVAQKWMSDVLPLAKEFAVHIDHALDALAKFKPSEELSAMMKGFNRLFNSDKPLVTVTKTDPSKPQPTIAEALEALKKGVHISKTGDKPTGPTAHREASGKITQAPAADVPATGAENPAGMFARLESKYGLPPGLLDRVWVKESSRGKNMLSPKGARGHFGFMPATAREYGLQNPDDLPSSADAAARKYSDLLKRYGGDVKQAAAAYNWGDGNLAKYGMKNAPFETRDYAASIAANGQGNAGKTVNINQKTEIHVNGADNPAETGRAVGLVQDEVTGTMVRNMRGAVS